LAYGYAASDSQRADIHALAELVRTIGRNKIAMALLPVVQSRIGGDGYALNNTEMVLAVGKPVASALGSLAAQGADKKTFEIFGEHINNTESNAFRHAYWNAYMVMLMGVADAKIFGDAHEYWARGNYGTLAVDRDMDLNNNAVGRHIAAYYAAYLCKLYCIKDGLAILILRRSADRKESGVRSQESE